MELSLQDVLSVVFLVFEHENIPLDPRSRRWHELFFKLMTEYPDRIPACIQQLWFDSGGEFHRSPDLEDAIDTLCQWSLVCDSPSYTNYRIEPGVKTVWSTKYRCIFDPENTQMDVVVPFALKFFLVGHLVVPRDIAVQPDFFEALQQYQYSENDEESEGAFQNILKILRNP